MNILSDLLIRIELRRHFLESKYGDAGHYIATDPQINKLYYQAEYFLKNNHLPEPLLELTTKTYRVTYEERKYLDLLGKIQLIFIRKITPRAVDET